MLKNIRSSRKLEDACHSRIDVIWLMSGQTPDHSTIAAFITAHKNRVKDLFRRTVAAGITAGLIRLRHAAIDGTNIEANAGRGKVKSRDKINELARVIDGAIAAMEKQFEDNERHKAVLPGFELLESDPSSSTCPSPASAPSSPSTSTSISPAAKINILQQQLRRMKEKSARLKAALAAIDRRTKEAGKESKAPGSTPR